MLMVLLLYGSTLGMLFIVVHLIESIQTKVSITLITLQLSLCFLNISSLILEFHSTIFIITTLMIKIVVMTKIGEFDEVKHILFLPFLTLILIFYPVNNWFIPQVLEKTWIFHHNNYFHFSYIVNMIWFNFT